MQRPAFRQPHFAVQDTPDLLDAWNASASRLAQLADITKELPDWVACAAVSGSLARMESHPKSDVDLLLVVDDRQTTVTDDQAADVHNDVWNRLEKIGAVRPKAGGIFSCCARWKDLVELSSRGRIDEDILTFGHRIQLLLDSQPVRHNNRFIELQRDILQWYSEVRLAAAFGEPGPFHWLWQDVQRYWRSLRARTCWLYPDDEARSVTLNVKLRSSRLMLIFAFLKILQEVQQTAQPLPQQIDYTIALLHETPVERLFGQSNVLTHWNLIWSWLRDQSVAPVAAVPAEVLSGLRELAIGVQESIAEESSGDQSLMWIL